MPIKRGDRLIMTVKGSGQPVVAVLDEHDGTVVVRQRGGVTSKRPVSNLRPDTSAAAAVAADVFKKSRRDCWRIGLSLLTGRAPLGRDRKADKRVHSV